jgi:hypothetical protein
VPGRDRGDPGADPVGLRGSNSDLPEQIDVLLSDAAELLRAARADIRVGVARARTWANQI